MKVYKALRNFHEDTQILQDDLNAPEQWSTDWHLSFNTTKCEVMRISQKNDTSSPGYHLCGNRSNTVSKTKDLNIYIMSNSSWSLQATKCANKANSVLGFVRWTVGPNNPDLFSKLYKSLVRPLGMQFPGMVATSKERHCYSGKSPKTNFQICPWYNCK